METNHILVAHIISANGVLHGYWATRVQADIRCRWTEPSAPGQPRPKPAQAGNPGDWRWRDRVVRPPGYGGGSRDGVKPSPGAPRWEKLRRLCRSSDGIPGARWVCAWFPPGLAEGPEHVEHVQQISKGHCGIQFQSRWMISCCWGSPLCSSHQGGVHICRSGSLLAALSRQCLPRRDGPANLEAPLGHCSARPRLRGSKPRL